MTQVLIQWQWEGVENATWENLYQLQQQFPHLVGKVFKFGGGRGGYC